MSAIATLSTELAALTKRVTSLETSRTADESAIATLKTRLTKDESMIAAMTSSGPAAPDRFVYIVSSALASLPSPGNRVGPSDAANMPKILTTNSSPALATKFSAHHYRFVGIEISATFDGNFGAFVLGQDGPGGATANTLAKLPTDITLDRCYVHGTSTTNLQRAVTLNGIRAAIIDSYLADGHWNGADAQAVLATNTPGPLKIVNNYLEGAAENLLLGGADPAITNCVPSDVEIRRNYFFKPLTWKTDDPSYAGIAWTIKNIFELKNAARVLAEGNILEHNWLQAQSGFAVLFTVRNQDGTAPWCTVEDVVYRKNILRHSANAINGHGYDSTFPSGSQFSKRFAVRDNLFDDISPTTWGSGGDGILFQILSDMDSYSFEHNTAFNIGRVIAVSGTANTNFKWRNNIAQHGDYGVLGDGTGEGNPTLATYFPGAVFDYNVLVAAASGDYPANNFFPVNIATVGFVNYAAGDYALTSGSAYHNAGSDSTDIGADIAALNAATASTLNGLWGSEPPTYSGSGFYGVAELPRTYIDTTYRPQSGNVIAVHSGGDLQAAINSANLGDTIVVDAGATFTGNFNLPAK